MTIPPIQPDDDDDIPLLKNPEFILLFVPKDHDKKMRLVRPAADPVIREKLGTKGPQQWIRRYYALSHLWGIPNEEKEQHMWHEIGDYVNDENGSPVEPIPMRKEKRETLLTLLRTAEASSSLWNSGNDHDQDKADGCNEDGDDSGRYWWIDVLCARVTTPLVIMGDIYKSCALCVAMIDCEPPIFETVFNKMMRLASKGNDDYRTWLGRHSEMLQAVYPLTRCKWYKRVWTWQEVVLPGITSLIPETIGDGPIKALPCTIVFMAIQAIGIPETLRRAARHSQRSDTSSSDEMLEYMDASESTVESLKMAATPWQEICQPKLHMLHLGKGESSAYMFVETMQALGNSTRECVDSVDYVYGVLGMLQLDIPRMKDHRAVWKAFLTKLEKRIELLLDSDNPKDMPGLRIQSISISDQASDLDLSTAHNMTDVYSGLLVVTFEGGYVLQGPWTSDTTFDIQIANGKNSVEYMQ